MTTNLFVLDYAQVKAFHYIVPAAWDGERIEHYLEHIHGHRLSDCAVMASPDDVVRDHAITEPLP